MSESTLIRSLMQNSEKPRKQAQSPVRSSVGKRARKTTRRSSARSGKNPAVNTDDTRTVQNANVPRQSSTRGGGGQAGRNDVSETRLLRPLPAITYPEELPVSAR